MKPEATLEDYQRREVFLIRYIESQIEKINPHINAKIEGVLKAGKINAYKDILYKLTKDDSTADSK